MQNLITWPYVLRKGHSDNPAEGACAADVINYLVHGKHGDDPPCTCPIILRYLIAGNDLMSDDERQKLLPFLHRIAGSKSVEHEAARLRILVLAATRVFAANALDSCRLEDEAERLRNLSDNISYSDLHAIARDVRAARLAAADDAAAAAASAATGAAADAACAAAHAASASAADAAGSWSAYFTVLEACLAAGPQGEPWSADTLQVGVEVFKQAGRKAELLPL